MRQIQRQGDVLLISTRKRPSAEAKPIVDEHGRVILALGEATGHHHQVIGGTLTAIAGDLAGVPCIVKDADPVPAMELFEEPDGTRLLVIKRESLLTHQEHGPISLAPGGYEVRRQREYSPEAIRNVAD